MNNYINISKVTPPSLPEIIHRPRLTELLTSNQEREITIVTGQAGTGKTTLAASYVNTLEIHSAWAKLDSGDSDPINFYYTLTQSLQYTFPERDFTSQLLYPTISAGPRSDIQLFREWVNVLFGELRSPLLFVIDDLESLNPDSASLNLIKVLLTEAPPEVRFILLSRIDPLLDLQKKNIRRLTYFLPQEQLAFTKNEIQQFFSSICRISLPLKTVSHIYNLSEGWVGGVILLSEYLKRLPAKKRGAFDTKYHTGNFREEIFPYFGEEIFKSLPGSIQEILIKLSIFDFIELDFAKEFLSVEEAGELLDTILKKNLFVKNYDSKGSRRGIRYHNLFRDFLQKQLRSMTGEGERKVLYKRAGGLFAQRTDFENAVKFYLKAGDYSQATPIIERAGVILIKMNRMVELKTWLRLLPAAIIQENPWLLYYRAVTARFTEPRDNLSRLRKALTLFEQNGDSSGQLLTSGMLIESSFFAGEDVIPITLLIEKCESLLESLNTDQYSFEKAVLLLQMGFIYSLRLWNAQKGCWASQNAYVLLKQLDIPPLQITALANLFLSQQMTGNLQDAEITRQKADRLIKKYGNPELIANYSISLGQYYTFRGDLEKALQHLQTVQYYYEELGLLSVYLPMLLQELMLSPHLGKFEIAEQRGEQLLNFASNINNILLKGMALLFLGASYYHKGDYKKALTLIDSSKAIFSSEKTYSLTHIVTANHFLGIIYTHLGRYKIALTESMESASIMEQTVGKTWVAQSHIALALLYHKTKKTDLMVAHLHKAMEHLGTIDYIHLQWLSRKDFTKACLLILEWKIDKSTDFAEHVLVNYLSDTAAPGLEKLKNHRDRTVGEKVFSIRKKIHRSSLPHIHLQTLGEFGVLKNHEPMKDEEWLRKNARTMLKGIIARGSKNIPKDCIIEDLWPEVSPDVGDKRFKVELHRLRKSLEPGMDKEFGSSYIHLTENLVSLDENLCGIDVEHFTFLIGQGSKDKKIGNHRKAQESFNKAIDMYRDDFLAQDLYSPWAQQRRAELKKQYTKALLELAQIYEERGSVTKAISCYKKSIVSEPLLEHAYQRLIVLYSARGKTNQALQAYKKLEQTLQTEIQSEPEPFSKKLYKNVILKSQDG